MDDLETVGNAYWFLSPPWPEKIGNDGIIGEHFPERYLDVLVLGPIVQYVRLVTTP